MGTISVRSVSKYYKRYPGHWSRLAEWVTPGSAPRHEKHWVLRNLSFEVRAGEALGIIGHNGAGKSTLLKIVTGTTQPSTGSVAVVGRVAALLELGMGFHPEFTGRQNASMAGQLLGYRAEAIAERMDEIESFAEIGDYIDQPVRMYSSGMQVRLAFSVATCLRPEILIVDEALSVGDAYFQHKSFDRIRQFREQGTTLLFVSHDPAAVKSLCDRAILLDRGTVLRDDEPDAVLDYYNAIIARREAEAEIVQDERTSAQRTTRSGSHAARIRAVDLLGPSGVALRALRAGSSAEVVIDVDVEQDLPELTAGILIRDHLGNDVFGTNTFHHGMVIDHPARGSSYRLRFSMPAMVLGRGTYSVSVALHQKDTHVTASYDWWDRALVFQVVPGDAPFSIGTCILPVSVTIEANPVEYTEAHRS